MKKPLIYILAVIAAILWVFTATKTTPEIDRLTKENQSLKKENDSLLNNIIVLKIEVDSLDSLFKKSLIVEAELNEELKQIQQTYENQISDIDRMPADYQLRLFTELTSD